MLGRCGTRTASLPGCCHGVALTWRTSIRHRVAVHRDGTPASSSPPVIVATTTPDGRGIVVEAQPLIIDTVMPAFDVALAEHSIVHAGTDATYSAARGLDFLTVHSPLVDAAMWIRGLPARLGGHAPASPPRLVIAEGDPLPGWLLLGEAPGRELAFGAVGRFLATEHRVARRRQTEFADFSEPGWGKIAASFSVLPYGERNALLTYECRTATTDADSRRLVCAVLAADAPVHRAHLPSDRPNHSGKRRADRTRCCRRDQHGRTRTTPGDPADILHTLSREHGLLHDAVPGAGQRRWTTSAVATAWSVPASSRTTSAPSSVRRPRSPSSGRRAPARPAPADRASPAGRGTRRRTPPARPRTAAKPSR